MSNCMSFPIRTYGGNRVFIAGSFAPAGTGAVTDKRGKGFTVARSNVGINTVTLQDYCPQIDAVIAGVQLASADDKYIQVGTISLTAKTIVLNTWDISGAALADISANANNRINFMVLARLSGAEY